MMDKDDKDDKDYTGEAKTLLLLVSGFILLGGFLGVVYLIGRYPMHWLVCQ